MSWNDNTFPDADDPLKVGWMIMYWRIVKRDCPGGCDPEHDYRLESRQFEHLDGVATQEEADAEFQRWVDQKRESEKAMVAEGRPGLIKGRTYFLCKVQACVQITDNTGAIV